MGRSFWLWQKDLPRNRFLRIRAMDLDGLYALNFGDLDESRSSEREAYCTSAGLDRGSGEVRKLHVTT